MDVSLYNVLDTTLLPAFYFIFLCVDSGNISNFHLLLFQKDTILEFSLTFMSVTMQL